MITNMPIQASDPILRKEVVFVDTSVAGYAALEASVRPGMEIVEINGDSGGLAQIAKWAETHTGYDAIHILSHGSDGALNLGGEVLTSKSIASPAAASDLAKLGQALKAGGDLLLYGCDLAADAVGQAFVQELVRLTGADVAASSNRTGSSLYGGDWVLEQATGDVESSPVVAPNYSYVLASGTVTFSSSLPAATITVQDGMGGSTDISGITLQITNSGNNEWSFETPYTATAIAPGYNGNTTSSSITIKSSSQATNFAFKSIFIADYGGVSNLKIEGFDNGASTGSVTVDPRANGWENTFNSSSALTSTIFRNVDEIRISPATGSDMWIALNNIQIDNPVPNPPSNLALNSAADDTGSSATDRITKNTKPTIKGTADAGSTVTVNIDGTDVGTASADGSGNWTYTFGSALAEGSHSVKAKATDAANNVGSYSSVLSLTVDTTAPTVTDANISISGASGTGGASKIGDTVTAAWNNTSAGDNNVNVSSVKVDFSAFGGGSAVNATNSSGTWTASYTIASGAINGTGNHNVAASVTDIAGNTATTTDSSNATVDNVAPTITFSSVALSADTGASSSDFITNTASQTVTASLSGAPGGGEIVYGSLNNGSSWTDITSKVSGTTLTWNGITFSGSSTLKLKVTDAAGNDGTVKSQAYTLDISVPSAPSTPDMTNGTDTGASNSDNITANTTPTFTGTAESDSAVTLYDTDGTTVLGTATATGGNWSITSSTLSAGSHTVSAKATDAAGNSSSASSGLAVTVDNAAPTSVSLSATTIASSNTTSVATIATLSATDNSAITYSLATGNGTNDADNGSFTVSGTSLKVGGSSLTAGTYKIYLAATDAAGNVANQAFTLTVVDAPSVSSIVRAGGATATVNNAASSVSYTVTFSQAVTGVDAGDFVGTATGTASGDIASVSGSGTTYTVTVNNLAGDGTLRLDLNSGGTGIQNGSNVAIAGGYSSGSTYTLDHTAPNVPSTPDMTSGADTGTSNSDNITSNTTPTFTGAAESGSTVTLYDTDGTTVLGTGTATGGNWSVTSSNLSVGNHTLIAKATDAAGNVSSPSSGLAITVDNTVPTVATVSVPSNGSYKAGQGLSFTVNTSEAVTVDTAGGTPRLALDIGGTTVYSSYASGSGSTALVFSYTVQNGNTDSDGISVTALQANGGTLKDTAGNAMALTLNSVGATALVLVDTTVAAVNSVSVPANGTYYANQNLDFTVNFSEAVNVDTSGGTPRIAITLDTGGTVYADYLSGTGTSALVFRHVVANGEADANGITVGALSTNGGTLRDAATNNVALTLNSVGSTASINVDATMPQVTGVTASTANGSYKVGTTVSVTVDLSKTVIVDTTGGTPTLGLNSGGSATYSSGSGTSTLVFTYTVGAGENSADLEYTTTTALALNGATIKDSGGAHPDAVLTLAAPGTSGSLGNSKAIVVDTTAPTVALSGMALSSDTGASASDFITSATAQTVTATLSAGLGGSEKLYGSVDNGGSWTDITAMVSGTALTWTGATLGTGNSALKLKVSDAAGNDGAVLTKAYSVDATAPVFQSATVDGTTLVMSYTEASTLDAVHTPAVGAFMVTAANATVTVNAVAVNATNKTVTLTLASPVASGQVVTVAYTDPTGGNDANAIQDTAGNDAATLGVANVSNNTAAPASQDSTVTQTIDGVVVQMQVITNLEGSTIQTLIIPIVDLNRQEQVGNNTVADIPLVKTTSGNSLLTAQVPAGVGLQVSGSITTDTGRAYQPHQGDQGAHLQRLGGPNRSDRR